MNAEGACMDDVLFSALDRMVEAGGQKLAKAVVVGGLATKPANALLAELEKHQYVRKDGSKFSLTDEGRRAWEQRAGEARKRERRDRAVAAFLEAVRGQSGKALTAAQKKQFPETFVAGVQAHGLVVA